MGFEPGDRVRITLTGRKATIIREMYYVKGTWVVKLDIWPKEVCYPEDVLEKLE